MFDVLVSRSVTIMLSKDLRSSSSSLPPNGPSHCVNLEYFYLACAHRNTERLREMDVRPSLRPLAGEKCSWNERQKTGREVLRAIDDHESASTSTF